jgi:hypothetical protein
MNDLAEYLTTLYSGVNITPEQIYLIGDREFEQGISRFAIISFIDDCLEGSQVDKNAEVISEFIVVPGSNETFTLKVTTQQKGTKFAAKPKIKLTNLGSLMDLLKPPGIPKSYVDAKSDQELETETRALEIVCAAVDLVTRIENHTTQTPSSEMKGLAANVIKTFITPYIK